MYITSQIPHFLCTGTTELITAPLDGTILPGVTRDSILALCRGWGEFKVSERMFTLPEMITAIEDNRVCAYVYICVLVFIIELTCMQTLARTHTHLLYDMCFICFGLHVYTHTHALQLLECFGAGTAAIVSPVKMIGFQSKVCIQHTAHMYTYGYLYLSCQD